MSDDFISINSSLLTFFKTRSHFHFPIKSGKVAINIGTGAKHIQLNTQPTQRHQLFKLSWKTGSKRGIKDSDRASKGRSATC